LSRTPEEDEEMLQAAHAAMYFWRTIGNAKNHAHAAQLLAHVYALLRLPNPARYYLAKSQPIFFGEAADPWELALAHAVAANVAAAQADRVAHSEHYTVAARMIAALSDPDDQKILNATMSVVPLPLMDAGTRPTKFDE
jgi:hypothetical protein